MGPAATATLDALAALCALVYVALVARGTRGPVRLLKLAPALLLAATQADRTVFAAGFVFYALGDLFLLEKERWFRAGLAAFLVGHGLVVAELLQTGSPRIEVLGIGAAVAAGMVALLWPGLRPSLRVAVPVYAGALAALLYAAAGHGLVGAAGAALFLVSDTILGWNRFRHPLPRAEILVLVTYYAALGLLAAT